MRIRVNELILFSFISYPIGRPSCAISHIAVMAQDRKRLDPLIPPVYFKKMSLAQFWREHLEGKVSNTEAKGVRESVLIGLLPSWAEYWRKAGNVSFTLWWKHGRAFRPGSHKGTTIWLFKRKLRTQTLWWVQNLSLRHIYLIHYFWRRFLHVWLQSLKKVPIWPKRNFFNQERYQKTQNFRLISNPLKKF